MNERYYRFTLGDTTALHVQATPLPPLSLWVVHNNVQLEQVERDPSSQTHSAPLIQVRVRGEEGASRFLQGRSTSFSTSASNCKYVLKTSK